jgi:hypothetical protein
MILFPLMTTGMWFKIFTASPLLSSGRRVEDARGADICVGANLRQSAVGQS